MSISGPVVTATTTARPSTSSADGFCRKVTLYIRRFLTLAAQSARVADVIGRDRQHRLYVNSVRLFGGGSFSLRRAHRKLEEGGAGFENSANDLHKSPAIQLSCKSPAGGNRRRAFERTCKRAKLVPQRVIEALHSGKSTRGANVPDRGK